ncbi:Carboxymethylproline synthase [Penicillium fimorum]|uniref:Carboxymethylproline synthase n=1 Tax=Penicillium fimorum TaxID=1882269 RepID=A0A9W9XQ29_9EURO|nr:Carboxymethylproline synthase [Penicillium fimorum]
MTVPQTNGRDVEESNPFVVTHSDPVALVEFSKGHRQNPFSQPKMRALNSIINQLEADNSVTCIVLTGGQGRSFSAGGDFNETTTFNGGDEVDRWIDDVTSLYTTIAGISKPVIAAIDGYAVGLGLQIALCCDYRIGSDSCQLVMPEFRMGIACNFGGFMLEAVVGRVVMQKMLFTADKWSSKPALADGLLHEVVSSKTLVASALERAQIIGSWTTEAVQQTRPHINANFVSGLNAVAAQAKRSHRSTFATGDCQENMKHILTKNRQQQPVTGAASWILITSESVSSLSKTLKTTNGSGIHVYGQGAALNAATYFWKDESPIAQEFSEWKTSFQIQGDKLRMRTGAMNDPPLYIVRNTTTRSWAVSTDAFTLQIARAAWKMPVGFVDPTIINRDETTSFLGVSQLPGHASFSLQKAGKTGWTFSVRVDADPVVLAALNPKIDDFAQAGSAFITSLQGAVAELTQGETEVASLLSGGIDSGAVTTFAVLSGLKVTAYSAGSPWGNEHAEAAELANALGIPHVTIDLTADQLLAAAPESMRALGTAEQERVDIALTITALIRGGYIKERHILTGYGNDLLNLGLPPDSVEKDDLIQEVIDGIDITRHSGEFTDFVARLWGKKLSHPYWHPEVVRTALDIEPSLKIRDGREKAYFRAAMEPYVPWTTAWRQKIGIHLGGGLQGGLDATFGGRNHKVAAYNNAFKDITARVLQDPFASVDDLIPKYPGGPSPKDTLAVSTSTLTPSGAGLILDGTGATDDASRAALVKTILKHSAASRFVLVRNLDLSEDGFRSIVRALGEPVQHKFQTGGSDLMKLPATREKGNVVLGRGMLPAHTDGLFVGHRPDLLMLYASDFNDLPGSGETTVVDQVAAMAEMPEPLRSAVENAIFEYQIVETGHHMKSLEDKWFEKQAVTLERGRNCLAVSLPFPDNTERSWNIRVKDATEEQSVALLDELYSWLYQERYLYQHPWQVGDMLIIDNYGTLHGRTAISEGGVRCLFRGQVNYR